MSDTPVDIKPRSRDVTDGIQKAAARAMLRAVGLTDDDWDKPQIGIASSWNEITPCNASIRRLTAAAKEGVRWSGGVPLEFGTITVSDGISMGHEGMRASLVSREIIADSVEAVMHGERLDGLVATGGCDKSMPGMMMAIARLDLPGVFVYNGSTLPGYLDGNALDITSVFEAIGACAAGKINEDQLHAIESNACPGEGACGGMFTANTMSSIGEALGLSLPGSASAPAVDRRQAFGGAGVTGIGQRADEAGEAGSTGKEGAVGTREEIAEAVEGGGGAIGAEGFTGDVETGPVVRVHLLEAVQHRGDQGAGGADGGLAVDDVGEGGGKVGVLHREGGAVAAGEELDGADGPVGDPAGAGGGLDDDGVASESAGAVHLGQQQPGRALHGTPGDEPGVEADRFAHLRQAGGVGDVAGARPQRQHRPALRTDRGPRLQRPG